MRICVFEDRGTSSLAPLTLTRPAFELRCGAMTLLERCRRASRARELGVLVRPELVRLTQTLHSDLAVNDMSWLHPGPTVLVNARWLAAAEAVRDWHTPHVGLCDGQVAYVVNPANLDGLRQEFIDGWLEGCRQSLPCRGAPGSMIHYPWDLVEANGPLLEQDLHWFRSTRGQHALPAELAVIGPPYKVVLADNVEIEPQVVADTRKGPVLIDRGAVLSSFTRLEGPCYIGPGCQLLGAKLRSSTLGPRCRVGGEVEASIFQGHSNKYHDGFLGHSYLGEWVNIGAGTQVSDLRNDYGDIKVVVDGQRRSSGRNKIGAYIGDHSKLSIGSLINSGTVIGAFCNVLATGNFAPQLVPSFCAMRHGHLQELPDIRKVFDTAEIVMRRRRCELTETHRELFFALYEETSRQRRKTIQDDELRKLRRTGV